MLNGDGNGNHTGVLAIYERTEKVVAGADHRVSFTDRPVDIHDKWLGGRTVYLHTLLGDTMKTSRTITRTLELETITVIAAFLLLLDLLLHQRILVIVSLTLLITGLFVKPLAHMIARLWLGFSNLLGIFNSKVILTILFFVVLTPLALMYRLTTRNPLRLKRDVQSKTYFDDRDHTFCRADLEKMW
jgi:hypothetical protein